MNTDSSFAQNRLVQLTEQLLSGRPVTGDIIFLADEEAPEVSGATWRFEDDDHAFLKESGFRFMLMELLDTLIRHRAEEGQSPLQGIIHLENSSPSIDWLTVEQAEKRRIAE